MFRKELPALVLLDLMLSGIDGYEACTLLKNGPQTARTPIMMLTAHSSEQDIVYGLELGNDDYVTKPFSPKTLVDRVGAVLRRQTQEDEGESAPIRVGELVLCPAQREVSLDGLAIDLTRSKLDPLALLALRPGIHTCAGGGFATRNQSACGGLPGCHRWSCLYPHPPS